MKFHWKVLLWMVAGGLLGFGLQAGLEAPPWVGAQWGAVEAVVERVHFRGVDHDVRLRTADGDSLRFALSTAPPVGETVRLRIDPTRVIRFGGSEAGADSAGPAD